MTSGSSAKPTIKEASTPAQSKRPTPNQTFEGHENTIYDFVFLHDNVHIVSGSWDGTMRKWNCNTGLLVGAPWKGKGGKIYALALSPDGKMIACGREDGSVQRWNTDGEMIAGVWKGHSDWVWSLSWSPRGNHLASGSYDGTILIRKAENGRVVVAPINTEQIHVYALAYSPLGDRIASGGDKSICIWSTKTGKLVVGPIKDLGNYWVTSLVWSSDSTKLYSASDRFARVFDSKSGTLLHSIKHDNVLYCVALSPKHNVLACVGKGIAQLWDTESIKPLGQPFSQDDTLYHVSFSPDGHHLAYSGNDEKLTLWMVKDIAPQLAASTLPQQNDRQNIQQETRPNSPSSSCLDADATGSDGIIDERRDDPYNNFFQSSSRQSLPSATPDSHLPNLFSARRFLNVFFRLHPPADESVPKERSKRKFFARRSKSSLELATMKANKPAPEVKAGEEKGEQCDNNRSSTNDPPGAKKDKGKQRDQTPTDAQSPPSDDLSHPDDLDTKDNRNLWKRMMHARGKDPSDANIAPVTKRPEVVEVYAVRGFQRYVAMPRVRKTKPLAVTGDAPPVGASSSQPGSSSQVVSIQAGPSSHAVVGSGAQSSQATGGPSSHASPSHIVAVNVAQSSQAIGASSSHTSPSYFGTNYHTNHDSDSHTTIEGSFDRFLVWLCYPCGRYHDDF